MKLKRSSIFTKIVILALIVYAAVMLVNTGKNIAAAEENRAALQAKVDAVKRENMELEYDIDHAGEPEILEEIARRRLGLVTPEEKIFYDVSD